MFDLPDRLTTLIQRIEAGDAVTSKDVDRVATLQALDLARLGREVVRQACAANEQQLTTIEAMTQ